MPYITKEYRERLDPLIDELAEGIADEAKKSGEATVFTGLLNYTCTRLALAVIKLRFGRIRYWVIAGVTGVFKNISDEFYRRLGVPYEDKQIRASGDVDLYEEFLEQIEDA